MTQANHLAPMGKWGDLLRAGVAPYPASKKPSHKRQSNDSRVTQCESPRLNSLVTESCITTAIEWCLTCVPANDVTVLAEVLWPFADDFSEERPEVAAILHDLHYPRNRKSAWSLACAILAHEARSRNNQSVFWTSGFEVLKSYQQAKRGTHTNRKVRVVDELDACISAYLKDLPGTPSNEIFNSFEDSWHECIIEFDDDKDELVCQLDPDNEKMTNVGREEFARRVRCATGCM